MKNTFLFIYSFTVIYLLTFSGVAAADKPKAPVIPIKIESITSNIAEKET